MVAVIKRSISMSDTVKEKIKQLVNGTQTQFKSTCIVYIGNLWL